MECRKAAIEVSNASNAGVSFISMRRLLILTAALVSAHSQATNSTSPPNNAGAMAPEPTINPEDKCQIEGTVVSGATGEPLKKAHLSLRPMGQMNGTAYGTNTDAGGHFVLDDIDPGRYSFLATRNGFVQQYYSAGGRHVTNIELTAGQKMSQITFKMTPQGVIAGHVVDALDEAGYLTVP